MKTHDLGPLSLNTGADIYNIMIQDLKGNNIAEVICPYKSDQERTKSYALLFAAAPDLLEALKKANQLLNEHFGLNNNDEGGNEIHDEIRLAIKSATHE